jgi:hypothetical protein
MRHDLQAESKTKKIEKKRCSARRRNEPVDICCIFHIDDIRTCHGSLDGCFVYSSWALAVFKQAPGLIRALPPHVLVFPRPISLSHLDRFLLFFCLNAVMAILVRL